MAETSFARCRNASLFGLLLQLAAFAAAFGLGLASHSTALTGIAWYILGGVPLWIAALLVFRQHELAEFEKMDLEELRREKQAAGGGEGMFATDAAGGLGFLVAANRLEWMRRWLVPTLALINVLYLAALGWWIWRSLPGGVTADAWKPLANVPLAMIGSTALMAVLGLYSRFAAGMGQVAQWRLLRACGAYSLGNAVAAAALIVALGMHLYAGADTWERWLAYATPVLMAVLAVETLLNFVLDIYRPRTPGSEPRAAFDSRILGLISEPGGIAHSIAEAINYQFGFQVSQTWFYVLLQRALIPLLGLGVAALLALSCIVLIEPNERAIVERFGRQLNAEHPLGPGLHFKLPWPIDAARRFNTGQLHEIIVGYANDATTPDKDKDVRVVLWTDDTHYGRPHFNFLIAPRTDIGAGTGPTTQSSEAPLSASEARAGDAAPVHIIRMNVAVQYRLLESELAALSRITADPHKLLRDLAWEEVVRYNAAADVDSLLGEKRTVAGSELRERLVKRVKDLGLGLEIVYVGMQEVHPEKTVAESFRNVVGADQKRITEIRQARVTENQKLSGVAGDTRKALALFRASDRRSNFERLLGLTEAGAADAAGRAPRELMEKVEALAPGITARAQAEARLAEATAERDQVKEDVELGLGRSTRDREQAEQAVQVATEALRAAAAPVEEQLTGLRTALAQAVGEEGAAAVVDQAVARASLAYWNVRLEEEFLGNEAGGVKPVDGQAAVILAGANSRRWQKELRAVAEAASLSSQYEAYSAAPDIYQVRRYLEVLTNGLRGARKFFLAFDPGDRKFNIRVEAQDSGDATSLMENATRAGGDLQPPQ